MRCMPPTKRTTSGFTLIEMLVIAPIAILVIATFVGIMISMVGSTLISQEKTRIAHSSEQALAQVEQDIRVATQFTTTGEVIFTQGSNDDSTAWTTNPGAGGPLVLSQYATTANPINTTATNSLLYINNYANPCSSSNRTYNTAYQIYVVYFVRDGSLWRRTILPNVTSSTGSSLGQPITTVSSGNLCDSTNSGTPLWQKNSCTVGSGWICRVKDDRLADNVNSINLTFYANPGDTTSTTAYATARAVLVGLKLQNSVAGQTFDYTGTVRSYRLN